MKKILLTLCSFLLLTNAVFADQTDTKNLANLVTDQIGLLVKIDLSETPDLIKDGVNSLIQMMEEGDIDSLIYESPLFGSESLKTFTKDSLEENPFYLLTYFDKDERCYEDNIPSITDSDWSKGNLESNIVLIQYSDLQCPACKARQEIIKKLIEELGEQFRFVYRHKPVSSFHLNAQLASQATEAAGLQDKFWEMRDLLFEKQSEWSSLSNSDFIDTLLIYAEEINLDTEQFEIDLESSTVENLVYEDLEGANYAGVYSTPTFFLNGEKINPTTYEEFETLIREADQNYEAIETCYIETEISEPIGILKIDTAEFEDIILDTSQEPGSKITKTSNTELDVYKYSESIFSEEKNNFIAANLEIVCMIFEAEDLSIELEQATKEIFTNYGFDTNNEPLMEKIAEKYAEDPDVKAAIMAAIKRCNTKSMKITDTETSDKEEIFFYVPETTDIYFTIHEGYLIIGEKEDLTNILYDSCTEENCMKLSDTEDFSLAIDNMISDSFLDFYISGFDNNEYFTTTGFLSTITTAKNITFSASETDSGYNIKFSNQNDLAKIEELGIEFNEKNELKLHQYLPNKDIISFSDILPILKTAHTLINDEMAEELDEELEGIDYNLLVSLLDNEAASVMQNSDRLLPAFTYIIDLKEKTNDIETEINKLINLLWTSLLDLIEEETTDAAYDDTFIIKETLLTGISQVSYARDFKDYFTYNADNNTITIEHEDDEIKLVIEKSDVDIDGKNITEFKIELTPKPRKNPYAYVLPSELLKFELSIGVTNDNLLLISTNENIEEEYNAGMGKNPTAEKLLEKFYQGIGFFDIGELNSYIQELLTKLETGENNQTIDLGEFKNIVESIFSPLENIINYSIDNTEQTVRTIEINVDIEALLENIENIDFDSIGEKLDDKIDTKAKDFDDIEPGSWYENDVYYLNSKGIIEGYSNTYNFKAANLLNKVELLTLLIRTTNLYELTDSYYSHDCIWDDEKEEESISFYDPNISSYVNLKEVFTDISYYCSNWYLEYVIEAYKKGLIDKPIDGKLYPGNTVNRSETAEIIAKVINNFDLNIEEVNTDTISFNDVKSSSEYYDSIQTVYSYGIMTGTSSTAFSPNKELNRAEIATIIRRLLNAFEEYYENEL